VAYNEKGELDRALTDCSMAIELDHDDPLPYTNRGVAYDSLGQHEKAIQDHSGALELDPRLRREAREDRDLANVRNDARFTRLISRL
jgi:Flp pilus assembly protein TadD